jgi:hypothetical protein
MILLSVNSSQRNGKVIIENQWYTDVTKGRQRSFPWWQKSGTL